MMGKSILCFCTTQVFCVKFKITIISLFKLCYSSFEELMEYFNLLFFVKSLIKAYIYGIKFNNQQSQ